MKPRNMRTEYVTITPAMAKDMLLKNKINRDIKEYRITHWVWLMESQDWYTTHQGIAFYEDGTLADGQHRLLAIIKVN